MSEPALPPARRLVRIVMRLLAALLAIGMLYLLAAVAGALLRPGAVSAENQVYPIYLVWSDIHTDIIVPARGLSIDWWDILVDDAARPANQDGYFAFGWGSESFFRDVPQLSDISVPAVVKAMLFDTTVMHVAPLAQPTQIPAHQRRTLLLSGDELRALERYVLSTFALSADGKARPLAGQTYGYGDAFYHAEGRYTPLRTCNQWTSDGLRQAGVSIGYWTPFAQSITWVLGTDADHGTT